MQSLCTQWWQWVFYGVRSTWFPLWVTVPSNHSKGHWQVSVKVSAHRKHFKIYLWPAEGRERSSNQALCTYELLRTGWKVLFLEEVNQDSRTVQLAQSTKPLLFSWSLSRCSLLSCFLVLCDEPAAVCLHIHQILSVPVTFSRGRSHFVSWANASLMQFKCDRLCFQQVHF